MGKKANPAVIGGFVVSAVALLVVGVLVFGGGQFWTTTVPWVSYFPGSVKGLQVGAPVTFRGVKIGQVTQIKATFDVREEPFTILTPVYWDLEPDRITTIGISSAEVAKMGAKAKRPMARILIKRGLRAQLQQQSFVTGQKFIQLDFHPDTPIRLVGVDTDVPEFPTVESGIEKLTESIQDLPLKEIADNAAALLENVDKLVRGPELKELIRSGTVTLTEYKKLARGINEEVLPPTSKLIRNFDSEVTPAARDAMAAASKLIRTVDSQVTPAARDTLKEAEATLATYRGLLAEGSPVRYELVNLLSEGAGAARSLRVLADYLERHPEALLAGKGGPRDRR
ncbi:MAG: MlaD family protein [Candidatus Methylomirabilales bacterium]